MDNSVESNDACAFKIEPNFIPATAIRRLEIVSGSKGLGDVWRCSMSTQSETRSVLVAVKSIKVPQIADAELVQKTGKRIRREAHVWMQLSHDHILPLEGVTEGFGPLPALVTPWMENGSLNDYLRRAVGLSRERKLRMVREVAAALQYLHDKDIVHGDLNSTNVLVNSEGRLYLGNFGLSMILAESQNPTFNSCHPGNIRWMPPEAIMPLEVDEAMEVPEGRPTKAGDIYSYGCIMLQVFSGHEPYHRIKNSIAVMGAKMRGIEPFPQLTGVDEEIQRFARKCWSREIDRRPSAADIAEFFWSRTNIMETMKKLLSNPAVNLIPKAVLRKADYGADDLSDPSATLKCEWLQESGVIEVAVQTLSDGANRQSNDMDVACGRISREIHVREKLRRETILALYGMTTGFGVLPSLVYPWMAGGSLQDYLKREYSDLSDHRKLEILLEAADGIEYMHKQDIVHGNLTGDNILVDGSGRIRIANFSHSVILAEADSRIFSEQLPGDVRYIAPEFINSDGRTGVLKPTKAGDVYSYGCIAILVFSGKVPYWWFSEESQVHSERRQGTMPFHPTVEIGEVHLNLVRQCLWAEKYRPSIGKVFYLVLVQNFGAADLTNSVQRLKKDCQDFGGFAYVHRCNLYIGDIDASVRQVVSRYQLPSTTTCVDVAVKAIHSANDPDMLKIVKRLFREVKLWLKLEHENIVPLWGVTDGFGSLPALISPWLENGALTGYLHHNHKVLSNNAKFALLVDVARGLQYLHSQSIVHGDLSGNNVLVDKNGKARLADFGLSALLPERMSQALLPTNPTCTAAYMAPEYLMIDREGNLPPVFTPKTDVYSFGGIMLQVLEGKVPYHYIAKYEFIIFYILQGIKPKRPPASMVIDSDWDFIQNCWSQDMECRPSDDDILQFVEGRARIQS